MITKQKIVVAKRDLIYVIISISLLVALKISVGSIFGSVALLSDGFHSLTDLVALFAIYIGLIFITKPESEKFPYGYYNVETLISLFISLFILVSGILIIKDSIVRISEVKTITNVSITAITAAISVIWVYLTAKLLKKSAKISHSTALMVSANEMQFDSLSSLFVLVSILITPFIYWFDALAGTIIGVLLLKASIEGLISSIKILLNVNPNVKLYDSISKGIESWMKENSIDAEIDSLKLRQSGPFLFAELDILYHENKNLDELGILSQKLLQYLNDNFKEVDSFRINSVVSKSNKRVVIVPVDEGNYVSEHFARADFFKIIEVMSEPKKSSEDTSLGNDDIKPDETNKINEFDKTNNDRRSISKIPFKTIQEIKNPFKSKKIHTGVSVAKLFKDYHPTDVIVNNIGEISYYALKNEKINVYKAVSNDIYENIEALLKNELDFIKPKVRT